MPRIGRRIALIGFLAAAVLQPGSGGTAEIPGRSDLAADAAEQLDHRRHRRHYGRCAGPYLDQPASELARCRERRASTAANVKCCVPAPPVIEFDQAGKVVQGWGGDGPGYKWGDDGHGIHVDYNNFVWVGDNVETGGHIFKFTRDGRFVMRIGQPGTPTGSKRHRAPRPSGRHGGRSRQQRALRRRRLRQSPGHRVRCHDRGLQRHWGAYGKSPTDEKIVWDPKGPPPQQFGNPVHCITITNDGLVLVCDRSHNRIQMFRKDGTFVREFSVLKDSAPGTIGSIAKWPDAAQTYLIVVDDPNGQFHVVNRADGKLLASYGRVGHQLGEFYNLHVIGVDSKGNIYTAEVQGKRVQKFRNIDGL